MQQFTTESSLLVNEFLDIHSLDIDKIIEYKKLVKTSEDGSSLYTITGILSTDGNKYHKYCGFNKFTKQSYDVPSKVKGWKTIYDEECKTEEILRFKQWIKKCVCDPAATVFKPKICLVDKYKNYKLYKTLDNGDIGFIVLVGKDENMNNSIYVYGRTMDVIEDCFDDDKIFENLIAHYNPLEIFVGTYTKYKSCLSQSTSTQDKSCLSQSASGINQMTQISGCYGKEYDGNSILLRVGTKDEFRYIHIGVKIFEFVIDDEILNYTSSVGRNKVAYPYAESKDWCYSMNYYIKTLNTEDIKNKGFVNDNVEHVSFIVNPIAGVGTDSGRYSARVDPEYEE
jgi:hypothetical protein